MSEDITSLWLVNAALIEIYLLEKERGNSGRNRTIKMISGYKTITLKQRERGGGEKRERGKIGVVTA